MFSGTITDSFPLTNHGQPVTVLILEDLRGEPEVGDEVDLLGTTCRLSSAQRMRTDGEVVMAVGIAGPDLARHPDLHYRRIASHGSDPAADLVLRYPDARRTGFGDSPELSARLLDQIRQHRKRATCGALRDYEADGDPVPQRGDIMIAEDWDGKPALVYEVTGVQVLPFRDVPEPFALAEGEGDFSFWRAGHEAFFARTGGFDPDMPVVCERFRLREVLA